MRHRLCAPIELHMREETRGAVQISSNAGAKLAAAGHRAEATLFHKTSEFGRHLCFNGFEAVSPTQKYPCEICPNSFARHEHLARHMATHTDVCNKHVLSHQSSPHSSGGEVPIRACKPCAERRVRCSHGSPCKQCVETRTCCTYPVSNARGKRKRVVETDSVAAEHGPELPSTSLTHAGFCLPSAGQTTTFVGPVETQQALTPRTIIQADRSSDGIADEPGTQYPEMLQQPSSELLSQWRNSASDCPDFIHWSANSKAVAAWGWEHATIFHLHLSRIHILTPLSHIQTLATSWRFHGVGTESESGRNTKAQELVLRWVIQDQYKARLSVMHAACLLWHVRRYSTQAFLEPYAIYVAALVLWAYSMALQMYNHHEAALEPAPYVPSTDVPTELQTTNHTSSIFEPATAIQIDPDALNTVVHLDRPLDDELVQLYIRYGGKMTAHLSRVGDVSGTTAPRKILEEGHRLLTGFIKVNRDCQYGNHQANGRSDSGDPETTWGIQLSFAESLRALLQTSREDQRAISRQKLCRFGSH